MSPTSVDVRVTLGKTTKGSRFLYFVMMSLHCVDTPKPLLVIHNIDRFINVYSPKTSIKIYFSLVFFKMCKLSSTNTMYRRHDCLFLCSFVSLGQSGRTLWTSLTLYLRNFSPVLKQPKEYISSL